MRVAHLARHLTLIGAVALAAQSALAGCAAIVGIGDLPTGDDASVLGASDAEIAEAGTSVADAASGDDAQSMTDAASPPNGMDAASAKDSAVPTCAEACPAAGGTCMGGTCTFTCMKMECTSLIKCPAGIPCKVTCMDTTCGGGIDCASASSCALDCNSMKSCNGPVSCGGSASTLACGKMACLGGIDAGQGCMVTHHQ